YWRRASLDARVTQWANLDVETFADRYATNMAAARQWATSRPERFLLLRYEELVSDTEGVMATVCRFVRADFDPGAVKPVHERPRVTVSDPAIWGEAVERTKDWRAFIDESTAARLEHELMETLDALGYQRYTRGA